MEKIDAVEIVASCIGKTTLIWTIASFVEKPGTSRQGTEMLIARRPRMPFLGICRLPLACRGCRNGLPMEKIDACRNGCILYWKDDIDLDYCKFCGEARYKPTRD
ncbi:UNVERIFIED_CONTAM: hypothetical protein Slati_2222700 [Sesamum latifolium]|uniref:Uncharacterized protein n=1 Tax=Sesamum latifolium TaxID=2727402 RepID=A0AAW2WTN3_9LAMI